MKYSKPYLSPVNCEVSTSSSWIIGQWNDLDSSRSSPPDRQIVFLCFFKKRTYATLLKWFSLMSLIFV